MISITKLLFKKIIPDNLPSWTYECAHFSYLLTLYTIILRYLFIGTMEGSISLCQRQPFATKILSSIIPQHEAIDSSDSTAAAAQLQASFPSPLQLDFALWPDYGSISRRACATCGTRLKTLNAYFPTFHFPLALLWNTGEPMTMCLGTAELQDGRKWHFWTIVWTETTSWLGLCHPWLLQEREINFYVP